MFSLLLKTVDTLLLSKVWCVPIGGMCVRQPMTIGGSGSSYLYGMMDHTYRVSNINITELTVTFQENMPQKECEDLVLQAVTQVLLLFVVHFTRCHITHTDFRALTSC